MRSSPTSCDDALSLRLYRFLLLAYPRAFRKEYASEMCLLFRDMYYETARQQEIWGILRLWCNIFYDLVKTVCIEHIRNWIYRGERNFALAGKEQLAMALPFTLDIAQRTDIGRVRANNEDNLISIVPEDRHLLQEKGALFVVSDGMGGHSHGEVASELAVQKIKQYYYQDHQHDIPTALQEAIKQTNSDIYQMNEEEHARGGKSFSMGATCVAAVLHDQTLYAANVGDSRVYVLHEGQLRQITRDCSN